jgi:hypothetical protein
MIDSTSCVQRNFLTSLSSVQVVLETEVHFISGCSSTRRTKR